MLFGTGCIGGPVGLCAHVVAQGSAVEDVIPSPDLKNGNGNVGKMFLDGPPLPILVVVGMSEPVEIIRSDRSGELGVGRQLTEIKYRIVGERKCGRADERVGIFLDSALE